MSRRIRKDDQVKVMTGQHKGRIGKVIRVDAANHKVWIEGINTRVRHIRPNQLNPRGGKKDIHVSLDTSNVALIIDDQKNTSRVGFKTTTAGTKVRIAKKTGKEVK